MSDRHTVAIVLALFLLLVVGALLRHASRDWRAFRRSRRRSTLAHRQRREEARERAAAEGVS